jgi:hypothetical protein
MTDDTILLFSFLVAVSAKTIRAAFDRGRRPRTTLGDRTMGQLGFFDADKRLEAISAKGDPLETIDRVVRFASFLMTPAKDKKSDAGRKPTDVIVCFGCWCC